MNTSVAGIIALIILSGVAWLLLHAGGVSGISPLDWIIGVCTLVWLIVIVTVPWNIYFQARSIVAEAGESAKRGITLDDEKIAYTKRWADRALLLAILLHAATTLGMFYLATAGISFMGYFGAGAALILTFVRPVVRAYEYVRKRLAAINQVILYPREDVVTLKSDVEDLKTSLKLLQEKLDPEHKDSWASEVESRFTDHAATLERIRQRIDTLQETNKLEHEKIVRDAENATSKAMADAAVVNHVREIVRFFKDA
jgi:hypothetical protein